MCIHAAGRPLTDQVVGMNRYYSNINIILIEAWGTGYMAKHLSLINVYHSICFWPTALRQLAVLLNLTFSFFG